MTSSDISKTTVRLICVYNAIMDIFRTLRDSPHAENRFEKTKSQPGIGSVETPGNYMSVVIVRHHFRICC